MLHHLTRGYGRCHEQARVVDAQHPIGVLAGILRRWLDLLNTRSCDDPVETLILPCDLVDDRLKIPRFLDIYLTIF